MALHPRQLDSRSLATASSLTVSFFLNCVNVKTTVAEKVLRVSQACSEIGSHPSRFSLWYSWLNLEGRISEGRTAEAKSRRLNLEGRISKVESRRSNLGGWISKVESRRSNLGGWISKVESQRLNLEGWGPISEQACETRRTFSATVIYCSASWAPGLTLQQLNALRSLEWVLYTVHSFWWRGAIVCTHLCILLTKLLDTNTRYYDNYHNSTSTHCTVHGAWSEPPPHPTPHHTTPHHTGCTVYSKRYKLHGLKIP